MKIAENSKYPKLNTFLINNPLASQSQSPSSIPPPLKSEILTKLKNYCNQKTPKQPTNMFGIATTAVPFIKA
eukprot:m.33858 g.33858  ORF g.33858 m.33858 type:complete len:72 (-) comp16881_c1_seq1:2133-2348(-)